MSQPAKRPSAFSWLVYVVLIAFGVWRLTRPGDVGTGTAIWAWLMIVGGVGQLVRMAVEKGRGVKPTLKCGICGEHGGDPRSVEFCHEVGLNYVSCSPFRVPIARLAAAHAAIKEKQNGKAGKAKKK